MGAFAIKNQQSAILNHAYVAQMVVGVFLILFGYYIGREHLHLILSGIRTQGTIVSYKEQAFPDKGGVSWNSSFMPIVRFETGGRIVEFRDWVGTNAAVLNVRVTILYDSAQPGSAMIDRPVMNWIPWGPMMAVGIFLLLVGTKAWTKSFQPPSSKLVRC
jgi:hypothetical protein